MLIKLATKNTDIINTEVIIHKGDGFMEISALPVSMNQGTFALKVSTAVTKLSMDSVKENAQALAKMMELSVNPNLGSKLDVSV